MPSRLSAPVTVPRWPAVEQRLWPASPELREAFAVVTARSFGRPSVTAECGAPFLEVGGRLVVSEPPPKDEHGAPRWPESPLLELSLTPRQAARFDRFGYQILGKVAESEQRYPRPVGVPSRRPLF